jgi:hypothetical protein
MDSPPNDMMLTSGITVEPEPPGKSLVIHMGDVVRTNYKKMNFAVVGPIWTKGKK